MAKEYILNKRTQGGVPWVLYFLCSIIYALERNEFSILVISLENF